MKRLHVHVVGRIHSRRDRLLLRAVRGAALGDEAGLRQMDARRSAGELRDFGARPHAGLDHLGIQVEDADELREVYARLDSAGSEVREEGQTTCCYARSEKAWIDDPAGISWETFLTTGESTIYGDGTGERRGAPRFAHAAEAACCDAKAGEGFRLLRSADRPCRTKCSSSAPATPRARSSPRRS